MSSKDTCPLGISLDYAVEMRVGLDCAWDCVGEDWDEIHGCCVAEGRGARGETETVVG